MGADEAERYGKGTHDEKFDGGEQDQGLKADGEGDEDEGVDKIDSIGICSGSFRD
jgi:hypothetical protein